MCEKHRLLELGGEGEVIGTRRKLRPCRLDRRIHAANGPAPPPSPPSPPFPSARARQLKQRQEQNPCIRGAMTARNCRRPILILHLFLMLPLTFASASAAMLDGGCRGRRCGTVRGMGPRHVSAGWAGRPTPVLPCAQDSAHEQAAAELTGTYLQRVPQRLPLQPAPSRQERAALQSTYPARMCA